jgi:type II secretory pathway component GspD/PulD (secretin)
MARRASFFRRILLALLCLGLAMAASDAPARAAARAEQPACRKLPPGRRILKLNLRPETEVRDLVGWIAAITCKSFILAAPVEGKKVTIVSPGLITPEEAYRLFVDALDSVGLAVYPTGPFLRIVEAGKAKSSPIPLDVR